MNAKSIFAMVAAITMILVVSVAVPDAEAADNIIPEGNVSYDTVQSKNFIIASRKSTLPKYRRKSISIPEMSRSSLRIRMITPIHSPTRSTPSPRIQLTEPSKSLKRGPRWARP